MKIHLILVGLLLALVSLIPTQAQEESTAENIYYVADGYLYEWDLATDTTTQLTDTGYINHLHHTPVGNKIAFNWHNTRNPIVGGYESGWDYEGADVYFLENGEFYNVTEDTNYIRSELSWSYTGEQLIWWQGQITQDEDANYEYITEPELYFYNVTRHEGYNIDSFGGGVDAGMSYVPTPQLFSQSYGILQYSAGVNIVLKVQNFRDYRASAVVISDWQYAGQVNLLDVSAPNGQYLGLYYEEYGQWDLFNPLTQLSEPLVDATVELRTDAEDSLRWRYNASEGAWQLFDANEVLLDQTVQSFRAQNIALTSNGRGAAYATETGLQVQFADGSTQSLAVKGVHSVTWGAMNWQVAEGVTMPTTTPGNALFLSTEHCIEPDLEIGMSGQLLNDYNHQVYRHTHPLRLLLGSLHPTTTVTIVDGPLCADYGERETWWQVEAYGMVGWTQLQARDIELGTNGAGRKP